MKPIWTIVICSAGFVILTFTEAVNIGANVAVADAVAERISEAQ